MLCTSNRRHILFSCISFCDARGHHWFLPNSIVSLWVAEWWYFIFNFLSCNISIRKNFPSSAFRFFWGTVWIGKAGKMSQGRVQRGRSCPVKISTLFLEGKEILDKLRGQMSTQPGTGIIWSKDYMYCSSDRDVHYIFTKHMNHIGSIFLKFSILTTNYIMMIWFSMLICLLNFQLHLSYKWTA